MTSKTLTNISTVYFHSVYCMSQAYDKIYCCRVSSYFHYLYCISQYHDKIYCCRVSNYFHYLYCISQYYDKIYCCRVSNTNHIHYSYCIHWSGTNNKIFNVKDENSYNIVQLTRQKGKWIQSSVFK